MRRRAGLLALLLTCLLGGAPAEAATVEFGGTSSTYRPADLTIGFADSVTFAGDFPDHPLVWDFGDHPGQESGSEHTVSGFTPGIHRYYCRFHGSLGGSGMAGVVRVPGNTPPTVAELVASNVAPGVNEVVTFTAQGAADTDGTVTHVDWDLDGNGTFERRTTTLTTARTYGTAGVRTARARVFDNGHDMSATVQRVVDVSGTGGGSGIVVAFGGQLGSSYDPGDVTVPAGTQLTFDGVFSDHPLQWDFDDRPVQSTGTLLTVAGLAPGTYRFFCQLHGGAGGAGMSGVARVAGNQAPTVASVDASDTTPDTGQQVTFTLQQAADAGGAVTHAEWDLDGNGSYERRTAALTTIAGYQTAGQRIVRARVLDSGHDPSVAVQAMIAVTAAAGGTQQPGTGAPGGPGGPGAPGAPGADTTRPRIQLASTVLRLRRGGVRVALALSEAARLTIVVKRGSRVLGRRTLKASKSGLLTFGLPVRGRPGGRVLLEVVARDGAGNTGRLKRSLALRR